MEAITLDDDKDVDMYSGDIGDLFKKPYHLKAHVAVGLDNTYVLHLTQSCQKSSLAAALSNDSVALYDASSLVKKQSLPTLPSKVIGIKYSPKEDNLLYTCTDASVQLWDMRTATNKSARKFVDNSDHLKKSFLSFDVNCDDKFLAVGSEAVTHDAFLLFWDVSSSKLAGGYWDLYGNDINCTRFHPSDTNKLATGECDGQINLLDISHSSEDDALENSLNAEASVQKLTFYGQQRLAALLDQEEIVTWNTSEGDVKKFHREDITVGLKRKVTEWSYVVDSYDYNDRLTLVAGSSCPTNPCLRMLAVSKKGSIKSLSDLKAKAVHNSLVRSTVLDSDSGVLFSGSENGIICLWAPGEASQETEPHKGKMRSKKKKDANPY